VYVKEARRREVEVTYWGDGVARVFGALAGLASSGASAAVFLDGWPHDALVDELSRRLNI
jgi:hypothetical protein